MSQNDQNLNSSSPLEPHKKYILGLLGEGKDNSAIANELRSEYGVETTRHSVRRALARWTSGEMSGSTVSEDEAVIWSQPSTQVRDPETIITDRGLDPSEWKVIGMTVNEWDAPAEGGGTKLMKQLKIQLKRDVKFVLPTAGEYNAPPKANWQKKKTDKPELIVFTGDQQAPFHDENLHRLFNQFLKENKPDRGILIGDTVDLPDVSRHRFDPENTSTVQNCINVGYSILKDYVDSSKETSWIKLCGNHDERIRLALIDRLVQLYGITRAEVEGQPEPSVLSIRHLLRLDELGIEYVEPQGSYDQTQVNISTKLAARHGWLASRGSGTSALKTLEHLGYSVVVGHTHRQSIVHKTTHDINGNTKTLTAAEIGCMAKIEGGLGYAVSPDWQNGWATASVYPDGKFKIDLATYVNGVAMWRDKRYE